MPHLPRSARVAAAGLVAGVSSAALAAGGLALAGAAHAAFVDVPSTDRAGHLVLSSDPYPAQFMDLSPGDVEYWAVKARLEDAARATLSLELRKSGELVEHPRGLEMEVDLCAVEWADLNSAPSCATGAQRIAVATPADDYAVSSPTFELEPLTADAPQFLLLSLAVADSAEARADATLMGLSGDMGVGLTATAFDDIPSARGSGATTVTPSLPATGFDGRALAAVGGIAAGLVGLGFALKIHRKAAGV